MKRNQIKRNLGFTLVEVMVVLTIFGFIGIGLIAFMVDSTRGMFWATNKARITADVRLFTERISIETLGANTAYVYNSFTPSDRNQLSDRRDSGQTGDCMILVYTDPHPDIDDPRHYVKLVAYFRRADEAGVGPVYRTEVSFNTPQAIKTSNGVDHFEKFLLNAMPTETGDFPVVLELSRGLADGNLFRISTNNTIVINGEILHGNVVKEVTNTYNLTISPRG